MATVQLDGPGSGADLAPTVIDTTVARDAVRIRVDVPAAAPVVSRRVGGVRKAPVLASGGMRSSWGRPTTTCAASMPTPGSRDGAPIWVPR